MKPSELKRLKLVESHFKKTNLLVENICVGLTHDQRRIVEVIYKEFRPLIEITLTPDTINQLFTNVENQATATGNNRTLIGQTKDVAGKVNDVINQVGKWIQDTRPVQAFDQKFEKLKQNITAKFPDSKILGMISKMATFAKENPGKTAAIIGVLTALASLAGGPVGGAIAGQVLRGSVELLKGEKLSTAIGKGIKTAALGYLSGKAFEMLGDLAGSFRERMIPFGPKDAGLERVSWNAGKSFKSPGIEYSKTTQGFDVLVRPEEAAAIRSAMTEFKNGDLSAVDDLWAIGKAVNSKAYTGELDKIVQGAWKVAKNNDTILKFINGLKDITSATAQGATTALADTKKESQELSRQDVKVIFERCIKQSNQLLVEGPWDSIKGAVSKFGSSVANKVSQIGTNLTTKVTADKLIKAWKAAGSPLDSNEIIKVLKKAGVTDEVINAVYTSMSISLASNTAADLSSLKAMIDQLSLPDAKNLLTYIQQLEAKS